MIFKDRRDAGQHLALRLALYRGTDAAILALPRGGVVVGHELACQLGLPLDIIATRKIGHPSSPEYAIGVVDEHGTNIINEMEAASVDKEWLQRAIIAEQEEALRRSVLYRQEKEPLDLSDKIVIIVDDGVATGYTIHLALRTIKNQRPKKIIVAVPVAPPEAVSRLAGEADEVVVLQDPETFRGAVGLHYAAFDQVDDDEVIGLLHSTPVTEK